jgi:hypothetical protein
MIRSSAARSTPWSGPRAPVCRNCVWRRTTGRGLGTSPRSATSAATGVDTPLPRRTGPAPIPASSGRAVRHRLNPRGNRALNRALYTIAITDPHRRRWPGLLSAQASRGQDVAEGAALPQTASVRHRLPHPARRPRPWRPAARLRRAGRLTAGCSTDAFLQRCQPCPARRACPGGAPAGRSPRRNDLDDTEHRRTLRSRGTTHAPPGGWPGRRKRARLTALRRAARPG